MNLKDIFNRNSQDERQLPRAADPGALQRMRSVDLSNMPSLQSADLRGANLHNADLRPLHVQQERRTRAKRLWAIKQSKKL